MAGLDATQVRKGFTGALYVAPVGTTAPATTAASWGAGWIHLGYLSEEGPGITPTIETSDVAAWQSDVPVRTDVIKRGIDYTFTLLQRTGTALKLAMGGGTITSLGGGDFKFEPPTGGVDFHAFGLETVDGTIIDRWLLDRGSVVNLGAVPMNKSNAEQFPITVRALAAIGAGTPWRIITNDPAMAA